MAISEKYKAWASTYPFLDPLVFVPSRGSPKQIFVLLHGGSAAPQQLDNLTEAIKQAFPQALLYLPYGPLCASDSTYYWFDQAALNKASYLEFVTQALLPLIGYVRHIQNKYGLTGEHTALAGFDQGATVALEACAAQAFLAGRVLAFSGCYANLPTIAPPATTLHFFHGSDDEVVPVSIVQKAHAHLASLQADATLDIASKVSHELHDVLIKQAICRLQTCVPLRSWQTALSELQSDAGDLVQLSDEQKRTLH